MYGVGDAVLLKGTAQNYNGNTPEFTAGTTERISILKAPVISPNGGSFTSSQSVTITADADATIYYTTDGSTPTTSSSVYSSALNLTATTTVKAIAVKDGLTTGVVSATYTAGDSLPSFETITFSELSLSNSTQYKEIGQGTSYDGTKHFKIAFGGSGNDGKYYNTGSGIRTYSSNTAEGYFTISSSYSISKIEFTFASDSYAPATSAYSVDTGSLTAGANAVWTGEATSITITNTTGSGHWRLQSVKVTYSE